MKKSEKFSEKIMIFEKISNIFENLDFFNTIFNWNFTKKSKIFEIFRKFWYFWKSMIFSENISDFFDFRDEFFMDFNNFWCFGKENVSSFQKVLCLFTKYAPPSPQSRLAPHVTISTLKHWFWPFQKKTKLYLGFSDSGF